VTLLAVLGPDLVASLVPADTPILRADDLGAVRGDGVFETVDVRAGAPWLLDAHLDRMARSAAALDLDLPPRTALEALAGALCAAWPADDEGQLRIVATRGPESGGPPTVYATLKPITDKQRAQRRDGIAVRTLPLGVPAGLRTAEPALLAGAKTLSYAVNMAALREAERRGADDALFVSTDGYVLEGTRANLVMAVDGRFVTPRTDIGILAGTTQADVFRFAEGEGIATSYELVTLADLEAADALWLLSSVRQAAPVRSVNGVTRAMDLAMTERINDFLLSREQ
jgi:4-amino-4-deoxychorismate lyase